MKDLITDLRSARHNRIGSDGAKTDRRSAPHRLVEYDRRAERNGETRHGVGQIDSAEASSAKRRPSASMTMLAAAISST
jgi:hypothetical protein